MYNQQIHESSFYISSDVKAILDNVPLVTKKEIKNIVEPGDILLAYTPSRIANKTIVSKVQSKLMSSLQGMPYSSSKLITGDSIIGYGIPSKSKSDGVGVHALPLSEYLRMLQEACLIRIPNLSKSQARHMIQFMKSRSNTKYDYAALTTTVWNRLTREHGLQFKIHKGTSNYIIHETTEPLICSSIIGYAMKSAGVSIEFRNKLKNLWPRDFLLHPKLVKICRIEY